MKPAIVSYATDASHPGLARLEVSCRKFGWELFVVGTDQPWKGWANRLRTVWVKMVELRQEFSHAIHCDAYDVVAVGPYSWFDHAWNMAAYDNAAMVLATEVNCWPDRSKADRHPPSPSPWKYAHSQFAVDLSRLGELAAVGEIPDGSDDQGYLMDLFLSWKLPIRLDYGCNIFQSVAFCQPFENSFSTGGLGFRNRVTESYPLFVHGNGGTDMTWLEIK